MRYGICSLSLIPVYQDSEIHSLLVSQILYGETFKILDQKKYWSRIRNTHDQAEGWVQNGQIHEITEEAFQTLNDNPQEYTLDLIEHVISKSGLIIPLLLGSAISSSSFLEHQFEGRAGSAQTDKSELVGTALLYLNSPYLQGGRSPFGIDAAGLSQMVYQIHGYGLKRTPEEQALQGEALSFIEESSPGDLAFFDTKNGVIDHVGIIMKDNYIIHSYNSVRIDRIDHTGIFNADERKYTHPLRVIKKIL